MKRFYSSHEHWEDWQHGMYQSAVPPHAQYIQAAKSVLAEPSTLKEAMFRVVVEWPVASAVNLTNKSRNRRAWLGQAACCLACGASDTETKLAWHMLTTQQQEAANAQADAALVFWTEEYNAENTDWKECPRSRSPEDIRDV